jgi:hypothetical protein
MERSKVMDSSTQTHGWMNGYAKNSPKASPFSPASGLDGCMTGESAANFGEHKRHEGSHALFQFIQKNEMVWLKREPPVLPFSLRPSHFQPQLLAPLRILPCTRLS